LKRYPIENMENDRDILLAKWLDGSIQADELKLLEQEVDLKTFEVTLQKQKQFDLEHRSAEDMWDNFESSTATTQPKDISPSPILKRVGAILLLAIAILIGIWVYKNFFGGQEIETKPGQKQEHIYADGSKVQISPNTKIAFNEKNWSSERKIQLEGQAFFEVEKGVPFIVETLSGSIEVLGTAFDVWAMNSTVMRVQCYEGRVQVRAKGGQSQILSKGNGIYLNNNALGTVSNFEDNSPDWLANMMNYNDISINLVIKDLERFYGVKVQVKKLDSKAKFSGVIPLNDIDKAARYLGESMNWQYDIDTDAIHFKPKY